MKEDKDAYQGMRFPPRINPASGRFEESNGAENLRESIYLILMTQKGERLSDPMFGSSVMSWPFSEDSGTRRHMMERELAREILSREPRASDVQVHISKDPGEPRMIVQVDFTAEEGVQDYVEISV